MPFEELHTRIDSVIDRIDEMCIEAMISMKEEIIDLNVSQLENGIGSDGNFVGDYASAEYAGFKQSIGSKAPFGKVDTKLTGEFHSGFFAEAFHSDTEGMSGLLIDSSDEKTNRLTSWYDNLFGIAPENEDIFDEVFETIQETIVDEIT